MGAANILAVGDVVGNIGIEFLEKHLRSFKKLNDISFTVVNGENASGTGITPEQAERIFAAGADVITLGNHTFAREQITNYLDDCRYILRPANFAPQVAGRGFGIFETLFGDVCVINLIGRLGMDIGPDNPFFEADKILKSCPAAVTLVDFHAEATSERQAMGYYLDGRVSAVWGTHTHVQTSDAGVLPNGTGFISDAGMTGAAISILGIEAEQSVSLFLGNPKRRYTPARGPAKMECAVFTVDTESGKCCDVQSFRIM